MEKIFKNLSELELRRATRVNKTWNECIEHTPYLQRMLWKKATISDDANPHFEQPTEEQKIYCLERGYAILECGQQIFPYRFCGTITPPLELPYANDEYLEKQVLDFYQALDTTRDFDTLPAGLRSLECHCLTFGTPFRRQNLHPLMRTLTKSGCVHGQGSTLLLNLGNFPITPYQFAEPERDFVSMITNLCVKRKVTQEAAVSFRLGNDMFARLCTSLIVYFGNFEYVENANGVTIAEAIHSIAKVARKCVTSEAPATQSFSEILFHFKRAWGLASNLFLAYDKLPQWIEPTELSQSTKQDLEWLILGI